jgi:hypothetical protein
MTSIRKSLFFYCGGLRLIRGDDDERLRQMSVSCMFSAVELPQFVFDPL